MIVLQVLICSSLHHSPTYIIHAGRTTIINPPPSSSSHSFATLIILSKLLRRLTMQALSTRELFEAGAEGAWSRELYHLPSSDHLQHRPVETRYHLHDEKVDVVNRCIDPRAICSEGSEDVGNSSEEEDDVPHLRLRTKGSARGHQDCHHKHHLCTSDDDDIPMLPLRPGAATIMEWVNHNTPLLQEYAQRQISPPLIDRVHVELNHPTQFVKGTFQMLSNRNKDNDEAVHPTHRLEPQLLDGFVDIHTLANEYLRSQFGQELVGDLVPVLLTIITNNFYEAHMRLMDDIVKQALANMVARKGPCLEVKDFVFGFDLHMSQDMPFFVDVNHRVRDTLESVRPKDSITTQHRRAQTTRYGRTTKPTQQVAESEVKKPKKTRNAAVKKGKQPEMAEPATDSMAGAMTPATESASASVAGRPRKPLPARARVTPKHQNPNEPEASTSSGIGRRSRRSAPSQEKVARTPRCGPPQSSSSSDLPSQLLGLPSSIASPVVETTEMSQSFMFSSNRSQASEVRAESQIQAYSNKATVVDSATPCAVTSTVVDDRQENEGPSQLQASTLSFILRHISQLVTQPLSPTSVTNDAQLFEFVAWPKELTSPTSEGQAHQEVSHSQSSTSLSDGHRSLNNSLSEVNPCLPQHPAIYSPKLEEDDLLKWNKVPQEMKEGPSTSAADNLARSQGTPPGLADESNDHHPPLSYRISPLTTLLINTKLSEVAEQGETSPSPNQPSVASAISTPTEGLSTLAPTPAPLEESQTPTTLVGYDSDATDVTVSTLVASLVHTPKMKHQKLKSTRQTPHPSLQRFTITLPAQPLARAGTPSIADPLGSTQSRLPVASTSQPNRRSHRTRHLAIQIPRDDLSSSRSQCDAPTESMNREVSPLSAMGAVVTFTPEPEPRVRKKRKLGRAA